MIFVVPRVVAQFTDVGQQLPFLTRAVIAISGFAASWWWLVALLLAAQTFGRIRAMRRPAFKATVSPRLLRLPLLGRPPPATNPARFASPPGTGVSNPPPHG